MGERVIDSLVVTLGLNSKSFASGVKGSTAELASLTKRISGMFLGLSGLEAVIDQFKDLHHELAGIGFTALSLGVSGSGLSRLGEVAELFGGQASDAAAAVQSLQDAVYGLKYQGSFAPSLEMMARNMVPFMDPGGQPLPEKQVLEEIAQWSDRQAQMGMPLSERQYMARQMLPSAGGLATAAGAGTAEFEKAWVKAKKDQTNITNPLIKSQVELARVLTENAYLVKNREAPLLAAMTAALASVSSSLTTLAGNLMQSILPLLKTVADDLNMLLGKQKPTGPLGHVEGAAKSLWKDIGATGFEEIASRLFGRKLGFLGAGAAVLGGDYKKGAKLAISASSWYGMIAMLANDYLGRTAPMLNSWSGLGDWLMGLAGSPAAAAAGGGIAIPPALLTPPPTPTAPRAAGATASWGPGGASGTWGPTVNETTIGPITINTRATDAKGIADSLDQNLKRLRLVTDAESGQG